MVYDKQTNPVKSRAPMIRYGFNYFVGANSFAQFDIVRICRTCNISFDLAFDVDPENLYF